MIAGSRDAARSAAAVADLIERWPEHLASQRAGTNDDAAQARDLVIVATTWEGAVSTAQDHADALAGKIVVSMANGLERVDDEFRAVLPEAGSLAEAIQAAAPDARVVAAFQHVPAVAFAALDQPLRSDVIVCADDAAARATVVDLARSIPELRSFDGGSLANALGIEAFAAVLLTVNVRHKGKRTLRLDGVEDRAPG